MTRSLKRLLPLLCLVATSALWTLACDDDSDSTPANQAPGLSDGSLTLEEQTPDTLDFPGTDPDGDALLYHVLSGPAHGTLTGNVLLPDSGFVGLDTLRVRAWDGQDSSRVATWAIEVVAVNSLESARIIGESMALLTGGVLESLDAVARLTLMPDPPQGLSRKGGVADDSVFDPDSCIWSLGDQRDHNGSTDDPQGFAFEESWRVWLRDGANECLQFADSTLRWLDMRRDFDGNGWNEDFRGERDGHDEFHITEFNAGPAGMLVQGRHERRGRGELRREAHWIEHEFELEMEFVDVRIVPVGNRLVPVSGFVTIDLETERAGVVVRRSAVVEFTDPGTGGISFDDGDEWIMDSFTGTVNPAQ